MLDHRETLGQRREGAREDDREERLDDLRGFLMHLVIGREPHEQHHQRGRAVEVPGLVCQRAQQRKKVAASVERRLVCLRQRVLQRRQCGVRDDGCDIVEHGTAMLVEAGEIPQQAAWRQPAFHEDPRRRACADLRPSTPQCRRR